MREFDQDTIVAMLGGAGGAPRAAVDAIQHHGMASLVHWTARTLADIASRSGMPLSDIEDGVKALSEVGRIDLDGDRVIGVGGLTLTSTMQSLSLPDAEMHTWCALDAVGIPAAL